MWNAPFTKFNSVAELSAFILSNIYSSIFKVDSFPIVIIVLSIKVIFNFEFNSVETISFFSISIPANAIIFFPSLYIVALPSKEVTVPIDANKNLEKIIMEKITLNIVIYLFLLLVFFNKLNNHKIIVLKFKFNL